MKIFNLLIKLCILVYFIALVLFLNIEPVVWFPAFTLLAGLIIAEVT